MSLKITARNVIEYWLSRIVGRLLWPPVSVAVFVEDDRGVLALQVDDHHELPGGLVDAGELPRETGVREVKEETGVRCRTRQPPRHPERRPWKPGHPLLLRGRDYGW